MARWASAGLPFYDQWLARSGKRSWPGMRAAGTAPTARGGVLGQLELDTGSPPTKRQPTMQRPVHSYWHRRWPTLDAPGHSWIADSWMLRAARPR